MSSRFSYNSKQLKQAGAVLLIALSAMMGTQLSQSKLRHEIPIQQEAQTDAPLGAASIPYSEQTDASSAQAEQIIIHITGAVQNPGVLSINARSRLFEAVDAAGGFTDQADQSAINLAQELIDGAQYDIPKIGEVANAPVGVIGSVSSSGKININTADEKTLQTLDGIGAVLAERIVAHRSANGPFHDTTDLMDVSGIGTAKFQAIQDQIVVK